MGLPENDPRVQLCLPPGFRFYPTDEELMVQYLCRKVAGHQFSLPIIGDIDLYKFDPWVLPDKAIFGEKEWYFFSPRDRKYPNGSRPNRVAGSGYWKATGTDKIISHEGRRVGIKKALVFYTGKAPKGNKTNWIMHEYRLSQSTSKSGGSKLDDWVLCRIYKKSSSAAKPVASESSSPASSSQVDDVMSSSFPEMEDRFFGYPATAMGSYQEDQKAAVAGLPGFGPGGFEWAGFNDMPEEVGFGLARVQHEEQYLAGPSLPPLCQVDSPEDLFGSRYSGSVDPFGIRYLTQVAEFEFGFGQ